MKWRRILLILAGLVIIIMAFLLQDVILRVVVTPLAYLWWLLKLVYAAIPQLFLWIVFLVVLILIVITSLTNWIPAGRKYEQPSKPALGPVEILAGWVWRSREGIYYKWMIANRLGKLWREMSRRLENRSLHARIMEGEAPDWLPPEAVQRYLRAGLDESFVDYPLPPLPLMRRKATPFDLNVELAVDFLESQMEVCGGQKHL